MGELYPTPTRLALLQDIADGLLYFEATDWWDNNGRKHTAAIGQMARAGWTSWVKVTAETKQPNQIAGRIYASLTEVGERVLKGDQE